MASLVVRQQPPRRLFSALYNLARSFTSTPAVRSAKPDQLKQVEVDLKDVQAKLGGSTLAFVKKAEKKNAARAAKHVKYRKKDWMIGLACLGIAGGIYGYTIYAMKQEKFLDDFDMPDELDEDQRLTTQK